MGSQAEDMAWIRCEHRNQCKPMRICPSPIAAMGPMDPGSPTLTSIPSKAYLRRLLSHEFGVPDPDPSPYTDLNPDPGSGVASRMKFDFQDEVNPFLACSVWMP
jgi:hypothetical protein